MTQLIRGLQHITPFHKQGVVTIGNFDGVHRGHQALINKVKSRAKALHVPSILITFEPLPVEYLQPKIAVGRLTRFREKFSALKATGIDYVLVLPFNKTLASLTADAFVKTVLVDGLQIEHLIVGDDFRFGYKRMGDVGLLQQAGLQYGFTVESMTSFKIEDQRVSSTLVREALAQGEQKRAALLLGRPYTMMGRVVHGNKLGRQLGFPTANIELHRKTSPIRGVYAVRMSGVSETALPGAANIGTRPAVNGTRILLEVHLFDFDRDIYGRHVTVEFYQKLRDEAHYENQDLLKQAIADDVSEAKKILL